MSFNECFRLDAYDRSLITKKKKRVDSYDLQIFGYVYYTCLENYKNFDFDFDFVAWITLF